MHSELFFREQTFQLPPSPKCTFSRLKKKKEIVFLFINTVLVICNYILWQIFSICIENKKILDKFQYISRECYRNHQIIVPNIG